MKHIIPILTAALALAATTAFAAFDYDVQTRDYNNATGEGTAGKYYVFKFSGGTGNVYITDFFDSFNGNELPSEVLYSPGMGVTEYGYYKLDSEGNRISDLKFYSLSDTNRIMTFEGPGNTYTQWLDDAGNKTTINRQGYLLDEFSDGDIIEVWMSDGTRSVASNTPLLYTEEDGGELSERHISTYGARNNFLCNPGPIASLYLGEGYATQVNYGIYVQAVEGGNGGTFGAPLPGGLQIALIAGLFGLGFWYIRRRKSIAA